MTNKLQWTVVNTCRMVVSATFVFSGVVKLVDPHGTAFKIHDYLVALHLLDVVSSPLLPLVAAILLGVTEFVLGICLFFGIQRRTIIALMSFLTACYTPLTLWLAVTDAVTDCGCFGDAVHLSNWETFGKNVFLLCLLAVLWRKRKLLMRFISQSLQWIVSLFTVLYALFLTGLCLYGEPIIDFRPFHIGQNIPLAMTWPEDPSLQPEILDFAIEPLNADESLTTDAILADSSFTFLLIAPRLEQADDSDLECINALCDYAQYYGYRFLCLTASGDSAIHRWQDMTGAEYPFAFTDELILKTMVRSNPGLLLLHDGTIVGKWSHQMLPVASEMKAPLHKLSLAHPKREAYHSILLELLLWYLIPLAVLMLLDRTYASIRWWKRRKKREVEMKNA